MGQVRTAAAGALVKLGHDNPEVIQALLTVLGKIRLTPDDVRAAAAGALVKLGQENPNVIPALLTALGTRLHCPCRRRGRAGRIETSQPRRHSGTSDCVGG